MRFHLKKILFPCAILFSLVIQALAQANGVSGKIMDEEGESIKFVHIFVNEDFNHSYFSDVDGKFEIPADSAIEKLTFVHFDHAPEEMEFDQNPTDTLEVTLNSIQDFDPPDQRRGNQDNPAWEIIEKVIANERLHDPEHQGDAFKYTAYTKTVVDLFQTQDHKILKKFQDRVIEDSLFIKHHRVHGHQHLEVVETVAERTFEYPNKNHEKIIGLKITGLDDHEIAPLHTNHHALSFYGNYFDYLGGRYASPLGAHTYKKYNFYKKGTLQVGKDTVHVIFYRPRRLRNVRGLEGNLYINSRQYAVQAIVAKPIDKGLIDFEVAQLYRFIDNKVWFPVQMNQVYLLHKFPKRYMGTIYDKKTYFRNVELNPDFGPKDHGVELVVCDYYTKDQSEKFWNSHRIDPLTKKQERTYLRVDTLRHQSTPVIVIKRLTAFYNSKLAYRIPYFEFGNVFALNRFEGIRLGLSLKTTEDLFQIVELNTFAAYGFRDQLWKRGVGFGVLLNREKDAKMNFLHARDLQEPGQVEYLEKNPDFFRKIFTDRMDDYESNKLTFRFRTFNYHLFEIGLNEYVKRPLYDYQFVAGSDQNGEILQDEFKITETTFRARYAIREKVTNILGEVSRLDTYYPIFYINYSRGIEILGGNTNSTR